jgi:hypothetical protein
MEARGRKHKACFLKYHLGETLEINLAGKTTKKRQNSQHLHTHSLCIASPLHVKRRNQEGSLATRCQLPDYLGTCRPPSELSGMQYSHRQPWARSA